MYARVVVDFFSFFIFSFFIRGGMGEILFFFFFFLFLLGVWLPFGSRLLGVWLPFGCRLVHVGLPFGTKKSVPYSRTERPKQSSNLK